MTNLARFKKCLALGKVQCQTSRVASPVSPWASQVNRCSHRPTSSSSLCIR